MLPETFKGDKPGEWSEWIKTFEMYCELNGWSPREKAHFLGVQMRGKARRIYFDLSQEVWMDYDRLKIILGQKFRPGGTQALSMVEFRTRVRRAGESYLDLAVELRRLIRIVFPKMDETAREELCMSEFVWKIERKDLRLKLRHQRFDSLDGIVAFVMEWEAIELADSQGRKVIQGSVTTVQGERQGELVAEKGEKAALMSEIARLKTQLSEIKTRQSKMASSRREYCGIREQEGCRRCFQKGHLSWECQVVNQSNGSGGNSSSDQTNRNPNVLELITRPSCRLRKILFWGLLAVYIVLRIRFMGGLMVLCFQWW